MTMMEQIQAKREEILAIAAKHGARNVRVFGAVVRGEERADSDIDFLVTKSESTSAWFPASLVIDLEKTLNHPVDVVSESGLNPYLRSGVLDEAIPL